MCGRSPVLPGTLVLDNLHTEVLLLGVSAKVHSAYMLMPGMKQIHNHDSQIDLSQAFVSISRLTRHTLLLLM